MIDQKLYIQTVIAGMAAKGNPEAALSIEKYMKNQFKVVGMRAPELNQVTKELIRNLGLPDKSELTDVIQELWGLPEREYQYFGVSLLTRLASTFEPEDIAILEYAITQKPWWDTIDVIAAHPVGDYFLKFPDLMAERIDSWLSSDDFWLYRSALLCQLGWKQQTREDLLYGTIERCIDSSEFFVRKAIGWALREYSKTNPDSVISFVEAHQTMSGLSRREALKVVNKEAKGK